MESAVNKDVFAVQVAVPGGPVLLVGELSLMHSSVPVDNLLER